MCGRQILDRGGHDPGLDLHFLRMHGQYVHRVESCGIRRKHGWKYRLHHLRRRDLLCGACSVMPVVSSGHDSAVNGSDFMRGLPTRGIQVHRARDCLHVLWVGQVQHACRPDERGSMPQLSVGHVWYRLRADDLSGVRYGQGAVGHGCILLLELRRRAVHGNDGNHAVSALRRWNVPHRVGLLRVRAVQRWHVCERHAKHRVHVVLGRDVYRHKSGQLLPCLHRGQVPKRDDELNVQ